MSEPYERSVCDLTWVRRARLAFGLYSSCVPPRRRRLAQAYCLTVAAGLSVYIHSLFSLRAYSLYIKLQAFEYLFAILVSLWTGDEYLYSFFTLNPVTDVTLDSRMIFAKFQEQIKISYIVGLFYAAAFFGIAIAFWLEAGFKMFAVYVLPLMIIDLSGVATSAPKLLVTGLFSARLLVLKRRLQRYGFRAAGRGPQPYCDLYDEIWREVDERDHPLKLMLFFDLAIGCGKLITLLIFASYYVRWEVHGETNTVAYFLHFLLFPKLLILLFGHVAMLERADARCGDMALFTVTQLIKNPTAEGRRRMYSFLHALEARGARYSLLRALPVDARFALRALSFCFAQVLTFVNAAWAILRS